MNLGTPEDVEAIWSAIVKELQILEEQIEKSTDTKNNPSRGHLVLLIALMDVLQMRLSSRNPDLNLARVFP